MPSEPLHPVFNQFAPYRGPSRPGFNIFDFMGMFVRRAFVAAEDTPENPAWVTPAYPGATEDLFAWIDLLESAVAARGNLNVVELGAGYGAWVVRAALAARRIGIPCRIAAIEAEPVHFRWLAENLRDNGEDPAAHRLLHAAVSDVAGKVWFYVDSPWVEGCTANRWYGQLIAQDYDTIEGPTGEEYEGHPVVRFKTGFKAIEVPTMTLEQVMEGLDIVDFVHIDVQGAEFQVCRGGIDTLNRKARKLNIGTHATEVEEALRGLFCENGWTCINDYPLQQKCPTPYGEIEFGDGVQTWTNPRLG